MTFIPSNQLVSELRQIEESPRGDIDVSLTASKLAKLLKPFDVRPGHNAAKTIRGYHLETFADPLCRYLPSKPSKSSDTGSDQREGADASRPEIAPPDVRSVQSGHPGRPEGICPDGLETDETADQEGSRTPWTPWTPETRTDGFGPTVRCRYCEAEIPPDQPMARANGYCSKGRCIAAANNERSRK